MDENEKVESEATVTKAGGADTVVIDRRQTLFAAGAVATAAVMAPSAVSAESGHSHHADHGGHAAHVAPHQKLIDVALHCVNRGDVCSEHCISLLGKGDTSLKDCLLRVSEMLAACAALSRIAALDGKRLKAFAAVCADICKDCEDECRKHEKHHSACKACADSCAQCIKECKKLTDA
ncbi:MAG: four-helix bundle copper-binding protein [Filomicrobium sp.]